VELIERFRDWKNRGGDGKASPSSSSSDDEDDLTGNAIENGWSFTIKNPHKKTLSNRNVNEMDAYGATNGTNAAIDNNIYIAQNVREKLFQFFKKFLLNLKIKLKKKFN